MKIFITYSNILMEKQKEFAIERAKKKGNFDRIISFSEKDIDKKFYENNKNILIQQRGGGYWLWKPYFIQKTLNELEDGDYLFYSDAGACIEKEIDILIKILEKKNQDIMGFELPYIEKQWTKLELFQNMRLLDIKYVESNQIMASYILIKNSKFSRKFMNEWLSYACNEINLTDKFSSNIEQNSDFIEHRHDQSIFSLLYKKYDLIPFGDPSQCGDYSKKYDVGKIYETDDIYIAGQKKKIKFRLTENSFLEEKDIIFHYRKTNSFRKKLFKYKIRKMRRKIKKLFIK